MTDLATDPIAVVTLHSIDQREDKTFTFTLEILIVPAKHEPHTIEITPPRVFNDETNAYAMANHIIDYIASNRALPDFNSEDLYHSLKGPNADRDDSSRDNRPDATPGSS